MSKSALTKWTRMLSDVRLEARDLPRPGVMVTTFCSTLCQGMKPGVTTSNRKGSPSAYNGNIPTNLGPKSAKLSCQPERRC
ncbi:hypothetical protein TNCV_3754101 [Trichonephila clavipes]|nr:hypothetical protein TNCV_3754101 [Trichonephila clavipes]